MGPQYRSVGRLLLKSCLLALGLLLPLWLGIISPAAVVGFFTEPGPALAALGIIVLSAQFNVLRWHLLLLWQGHALPIGRVWEISYISWFLGSFLPGAVGADALRALYLHRERAEDRLPAILTILLDRLLGLASLLILAVGLAALLPAQIAAQPVLFGLVALACAGLFGLAALLPLALWLKGSRLPWLGRWRRLSRLMEDLAEAAGKSVTGWRERPMRLLICLALGVASHALVVLAIVILARAMNMAALSGPELSLAATLAVLANQVPITPGGLGIGETSFAEICRLLAPGKAVLAYGSAIFAFRIAMLLSLMPGAVALLAYRRGAEAKTRSMAESTAATPSSSKAG